MSDRTAQKFQSSSQSSTAIEGRYGRGKHTKSTPDLRKSSVTLGKRARDVGEVEKTVRRTKSRKTGNQECDPSLVEGVEGNSRLSTTVVDASTIKRLSSVRKTSRLRENLDKETVCLSTSKVKGPTKVKPRIAKVKKNHTAAVQAEKLAPIKKASAQKEAVMLAESNADTESMEPESSEEEDAGPIYVRGSQSSDSYAISSVAPYDNARALSLKPASEKSMNHTLNSAITHNKLEVSDRLSLAFKEANYSRLLLAFLSKELATLEKEWKVVMHNGPNCRYDAYVSHSTLQGILRWKIGTLAAQYCDETRNLQLTKQHILQLEELLVDELLQTHWTASFIATLRKFKDALLRPFI